MKIDNTTITNQSILTQNMEQRKAEKTAENINIVEDEAVSYSVSRRNTIEYNRDAINEYNTENFVSLMRGILSNPETAMNLHSGLKPERVIQLLA